MTTLKQDLEATKAWLENHKWGQGWSSNRSGTYCVMESAMGALGWDISDPPLTQLAQPVGYQERYTRIADALNETSRRVSGRNAVRFNDEPGRTKANMLDLIDLAIEAAS